jgi:hypothetical protein
MVFYTAKGVAENRKDWNQGHAKDFTSLHLALLRKPGGMQVNLPSRSALNSTADLAPATKSCRDVFGKIAG